MRNFFPWEQHIILGAWFGRLWLPEASVSGAWSGEGWLRTPLHSPRCEPRGRVQVFTGDWTLRSVQGPPPPHLGLTAWKLDPQCGLPPFAPAPSSPRLCPQVWECWVSSLACGARPPHPNSTLGSCGARCRSSSTQLGEIFYLSYSRQSGHIKYILPLHTSEPAALGKKSSFSHEAVSSIKALTCKLQ